MVTALPIPLAAPVITTHPPPADILLKQDAYINVIAETAATVIGDMRTKIENALE